MVNVLVDQPVLVERHFNQGGGLADVRLLSYSEQDGLRRIYITNAGDVVEMRGEHDDDKDVITWVASTPTGGKLRISDSFSETGQVKTVTEILDSSGSVVARGKEVYQRRADQTDRAVDDD